MHIALVRGRTRSRQTWRTYGEALYDWWQTLEANGWTWDRVGYHEIAGYRDNMLTKCSDHTGRPYARATINGRLHIITLFYRWCFTSGLISSMPYSSQEVSVARWRPAPFLAHADARGGTRTANELVLREVRALPRPLDPEIIRRIMVSLGVRDRLIIEWAALTGMRRMEIAGLKLNALGRTESQGEFATAPVVPIRLDVTKGARVRQVYPPSPLVDRTRAFLREERAVIVKRAHQRDAKYRDPGTVFLNARGDAMSPRRVGAMFAAASRAADVEATFHGLRHTFAGAMLRLLQRQAQRNPDMNPLLTLQAILGHSDLTTTAIYLRVVAIDLGAIEAAVDDLFGALG
ncbi:transposase [Asaia bogorensis NBRC 16594]|nr:transposase [Asaia bogorensis NBRC 16594]